MPEDLQQSQISQVPRCLTETHTKSSLAKFCFKFYKAVQAPKPLFYFFLLTHNPATASSHLEQEKLLLKEDPGQGHCKGKTVGRWQRGNSAVKEQEHWSLSVLVLGLRKQEQSNRPWCSLLSSQILAFTSSKVSSYRLKGNRLPVLFTFSPHNCPWKPD